MDRLRVLVGEDREQIRRIIVEILASEFDVVAAAGDGEQLVKAAIQLEPDVIISDIAMPLMDGISARETLISMGIDQPFVFVTMRNIDDLPSNLQGCPVSYVCKIDVHTELIFAVHEAVLGRSYLSRSFRKSQESP